MLFQKGQNKLIKKDPLVFEKKVEKVAHEIAWDYWWEKTKYPFTGINIGSYIIIGQSGMHTW